MLCIPVVVLVVLSVVGTLKVISVNRDLSSDTPQLTCSISFPEILMVALKLCCFTAQKDCIYITVYVHLQTVCTLRIL